MLTTQAQDKLLSQEIDKTLDSGNTLLMKFEELERGSNFSIARVTIESGTSIGSVPHAFEGFRRIGEMRDMKFMIPPARVERRHGKQVLQIRLRRLTNSRYC
jgi:hypothetical protein